MVNSTAGIWHEWTDWYQKYDIYMMWMIGMMWKVRYVYEMNGQNDVNSTVWMAWMTRMMLKVWQIYDVDDHNDVESMTGIWSKLSGLSHTRSPFGSYIKYNCDIIKCCVKYDVICDIHIMNPFQQIWAECVIPNSRRLYCADKYKLIDKELYKYIMN